MNINIKDEILPVLEARGRRQGHPDAEEYINFLLGQIAENIKKAESGGQQKIYTDEENKKIKERLRSLGYID